VDEMLCSVIICTHNPRRNFFDRVLEGLRKQTLSHDSFELVVVDNLSDPGVLTHVDLSWHPNYKIVVEEELGLTMARLRGFRESRGEIIVFCDDDNILNENYLEQALLIAGLYPFLGAWGGQCEGEFEVFLPGWANEGFFRSIGVRSVKEIQWSNLLNHCCPVGAGMVLRRQVADAYIRKVQSDPMQIKLGRSGSSLMSCEDIALANVASEIGMGTGLFPALILKHLIPRERLTLEYYERLTEGITASLILLRHSQGCEPRKCANDIPPVKLILKDVYFKLRNSKEDYVIYKARKRGEAKGMAMVKQMLTDDSKGL